jgi:hypothetical protein
MQHLEVNGAVQHIYVVWRQRVNHKLDCRMWQKLADNIKKVVLKENLTNEIYSV